MSRSRCLLCLVLTLSIPATASAAVVYVSPGGDDGNSGADWANAKETVNGAIAVAAQGDEIWVAAGIYYENVQNRIVGEQAVDVALYGGFAGDETALEQREIQANLTTLHGGGAGTVVTITGVAGPDTRVDGFYITGGDAIHGGGIKIVASAPVIANNLIRYNLTDGLGAGISVWGFNPVLDLQPVIIDNVIVDNFAYAAEGDGGGIGLVGSSPEISNNVIARNRANQNGGGICCWAGGDDAVPLNCSPTVANNWILANSANLLDGGSDVNFGGGGIFASAHDMTDKPIGATSEPTIVNNVIGANGAWLGGGIELRDSISGAPTVVGNTIVANNGAGIHWFNTSPEIANNLVAYNTWGLHAVSNGQPDATLASNDVYGNQVRGESADFLGLADPTGTAGNISADPLLANLAIGEFHVQPGSPCIDAGAADRVVGPWPDVDGDERILGDGPDIGADESDGTLWDVAGVVIHVTPGGDDGSDGLSWAAAKATVEAGIEAAAENGGEVWVAAGTYPERVTVPAFVYLYGGFAGSETAREQRDVGGNPTILDGGGTPTVVRSENAGYRVSAVDGFTIQNGGVYSGGDLMQIVPNTGRGAGLFSLVTGPIVANNTIRWNSVGTPFAALDPAPEGGGLAGYLSHAWIHDNTLTENEVLSLGGQGGGMWFKLSSPLIEGNLLTGNHAKYGAAVYGTGSSPRLHGNVIDSNEMYVWSGLIDGSAFGAVYLWLCEDPLVDGNLFRDNVADQGGGLALITAYGARVESNLFDSNQAWDYSGFGDGGRGGGLILEASAAADKEFHVVNNTFVGNTATHSIYGERGGAIAIVSDHVVIANNVMAYNSSGIYQDSVIRTPEIADNALYNYDLNYVNVAAGPGDVILDPEFVDFAGGDYSLAPASRCVDAGDDGRLHGGLEDFSGAERVVDGDYDGLATVDRGAYERWRDRDDDGLPDDSDSDDDDDGVPDGTDNCPYHVNPGQEDGDGDGLGDACDADWDNDGVEQTVSDPSRVPFMALDVTAAASTIPAQPAGAYIFVGVFDTVTDTMGWWDLANGSWIDSGVAPYRKPVALYVDANSCACIDLGAGETLTVTTDNGTITAYLPDQPAGWEGALYVAEDGSTWFDSLMTDLAQAAPPPPGDNCAESYNPAQGDLDSDGEGDVCDLDDGTIYLVTTAQSFMGWQAEAGFLAWNAYRGDLAALRDSGVYTQEPGSNDLAWRWCGLPDPEVTDSDPLTAGAVAFYLMTGETGSGEGSLGPDWTGSERYNDNPCP